jgi:hypothetical protein
MEPRRLLTLLAAAVALGCAGNLTAISTADDQKPPQVLVEAPTNVTIAGATLNGQVHPGGRETKWFFEYGTTVAYGSKTADRKIGDKAGTTPVSATIAGLEPGTTYHFRLYAKNKEGTTRSADQTFATSEQPTGDGTDPGTGDPGTGDPPPTDPGTGTGTGDGSGAGETTSDGPQLGSSVVVAPGQGTLLVRRPGRSSFVPLTFGSELPIGTEVDAREGSIALTSALPSGKVQTGTFGGGRFKIGQGKRGYIDLYLRGRACADRAPRAVASAATVATAARRKRAPRLWGRDHGGRFRTHGRNSHATVRGTRWVVIETCKGTLTRVSKGAVVVTDTVRRKRVLVKAGGHHLARPRT